MIPVFIPISVGGAYGQGIAEFCLEFPPGYYMLALFCAALGFLFATCGFGAAHISDDVNFGRGSLSMKIGGYLMALAGYGFSIATFGTFANLGNIALGIGSSIFSEVMCYVICAVVIAIAHIRIYGFRFYVDEYYMRNHRN